MAVNVQKQVQLPLRKAFEIAFKSLRIRFARSLLTLLTIAMAIAFLTDIWAGRTVETTLRAISGTFVAIPASPQRTIWLLVLSLLVCLVGITNAMLMSVMERYREIGTMKCLGALDSFILKLFFLESLFLGFVGSVAGALIGIPLMLFTQLRTFGAASWPNVPWSAVWTIAAASAAIGLLITAAAALYPAWQAARMEPIAAMRADV